MLTEHSCHAGVLKSLLELRPKWNIGQAALPEGSINLRANCAVYSEVRERKKILDEVCIVIWACLNWGSTLQFISVIPWQWIQYDKKQRGEGREKNKFTHVTKALISSHPKLLAIILKTPHGVYCFPFFGELADQGKISKYYWCQFESFALCFPTMACHLGREDGGRVWFHSAFGEGRVSFYFQYDKLEI